MTEPELTYTTSDLSRRSGDIITAAIRAPVTITQRNKPRLVLLSIETFEAMRKRADPRFAGKTAEMPADLAEEFLEAIDAYHEDANK